MKQQAESNSFEPACQWSFFGLCLSVLVEIFGRGGEQKLERAATHVTHVVLYP